MFYNREGGPGDLQGIQQEAAATTNEDGEGERGGNAAAALVVTGTFVFR